MQNETTNGLAEVPTPLPEVAKSQSDCDKSRHAKYYQDHKPEISVKGKEYYEKNKEKIKARGRAFYYANRERQRRRSLEYYYRTNPNAGKGKKRLVEPSSDLQSHPLQEEQFQQYVRPDNWFDAINFDVCHKQIWTDTLPPDLQDKYWTELNRRVHLAYKQLYPHSQDQDFFMDTVKDQKYGVAFHAF